MSQKLCGSVPQVLVWIQLIRLFWMEMVSANGLWVVNEKHFMPQLCKYQLLFSEPAATIALTTSPTTWAWMSTTPPRCQGTSPWGLGWSSPSNPGYTSPSRASFCRLTGPSFPASASGLKTTSWSRKAKIPADLAAEFCHPSALSRSPKSRTW